MREETIHIGDRQYRGCVISLFHADLLVIRGDEGFLGCGYINLDACEKFGDAAAIVTGVSSCSEMLTAEVKKVSAAAAARGVTVGMTGADALRLL